MLNCMDFDFTTVDDCLTSFDSETLDSDLDMFISVLGLDTAIADKFAKQIVLISTMKM